MMDSNNSRRVEARPRLERRQEGIVQPSAAQSRPSGHTPEGVMDAGKPPTSQGWL